MPLHPEALTWTVLLGKWIDFAKATVALRPDQDGDRWRASVPAIINLQAVTFALADFDHLPADEHAHALDKAQLLIDAAVGDLDEIWIGVGQSPALEDIIADARLALATRQRPVL